MRIGIINIMPRAENYEPYLIDPLSGAALPLDVSWIRLESHIYTSSDRQHIERGYRSFDQTVAAGPLDGLILTGAPVEELSYDKVKYWDELVDILTYARGFVRSTLGLCWGGMALARQLGIHKRAFSQKLFGVFENRNLFPEGGLLGDEPEHFWCAHSRHAGIADADLERARDEGTLLLLSHAEQTGYSLFETPDHRYVMHLGHPEYLPSRLVEEWRRDIDLGRTDVEAPRNLDADAPIRGWRAHRAGVFSRWLRAIAAAKARHEGRLVTSEARWDGPR